MLNKSISLQTTGMFRGDGKLSMAHSGSTLELHLSNDPLFFSLPGKQQCLHVTLLLLLLSNRVFFC